MKLTKALTIPGAIMIVFGFVFHLQGAGHLGPESSFMYYNPDWFYYGLAIMIAGIVLAGLGVFLQKVSRSR